MDGEQLKQDVREGRIDAERLVDLIILLQDQLANSEARIKEAEARIKELEKQVGGPTQKLSEPFSMRSEEKRQEARSKKRKRKRKPLRRGRISSAEKLALAVREEAVYPDGCEPNDCVFSHKRPLWRFEHGKAVVVAYRVYRCGNTFGRIPGSLGRSELALEIVIAIAYQVYVLGLSFDKVCSLLSFFQGLEISKSRANAAMTRLARAWEAEFETICTILAHSAVVYADETGWSINSVWAFLSEKVRVLLFGVHKDAETLATVLDRELFDGVLVSDDAAVYREFNKAQKCWAHLIRKAIKLTLEAPDNAVYREFADGLIALYRKACRLKSDGRFSDQGRQVKIAELDEELTQLCIHRWVDRRRSANDTEDAYRLLSDELMRLMIARELFTFVVEPGVDGTNNEAERSLRGASQARKTCRTNKTLQGARRQSIIQSVLESVRKQLSVYKLRTVVDEVTRWLQVGRSCFQELAQSAGLLLSGNSVLAALFPEPDSS